MCKDPVVDLYERHHEAYDRDRREALLQERAWLDRFHTLIRPGGTVLDVGCGVGVPIASHLVALGFEILGVDAAPSMIEACRARLPNSHWVLADMRELELGRSFDGILVWDSLFHLGKDDQRAMFPRFASHAHHGTSLMFTSGPAEGESIGSYRGDPLQHVSLSPEEYEHLLTMNGFGLRAHVENDPECGGHTVWLAARDG